MRNCIGFDSAAHSANVHYHLVVSANEVTARDCGGIRLNNDILRIIHISMEHLYVLGLWMELTGRLLLILCEIRFSWFYLVAIEKQARIYDQSQRFKCNGERIKGSTDLESSKPLDLLVNFMTMHLARFSFILMFQLYDSSIDRLRCIRSACLQLASDLTSFVNIGRLKLAEGPCSCKTVHASWWGTILIFNGFDFYCWIVLLLSAAIHRTHPWKILIFIDPMGKAMAVEQKLQMRDSIMSSKLFS